jgi:hypothetical protein
LSAHLSGFDAITPAFERAKRQLFTPFRFGHWSRLAIIVMSTGELTGGGGGGWSGLSGLPGAASGSSGKHFLPLGFLPDSPSFGWADYFPWIMAGFAVIVLFVLAFMYVASVFRFIMFDSVLYDRCDLGVGWRRFQPQGMSYFLWTLGFGFSGLVVMSFLIGVPAYLAWLAGVFSEPDQHIAFLVIGGLAILFLAVTIVLVAALISLFARDFVVPVMALENLGVMDAWRHVLPMLGAEKGAFTIYVLMKIGLAMGAGMLFSIVDFFVLLVLLIPLGIIAVAAVLLGAAVGLTWDTFTICMAVLVGGLILMLLVYIICFVSAPAMVFFQSYTLHFFGSRYPRLGDQLALTSPPAKPTPIIPGEAAPLPAS